MMSTSHAEKTSDHAGNDVRRLHTHELEVGVTDAVRRHVQRHVIPPKPASSGSLILNTLDHSGREKWLPKPLVCFSMCKLAAFIIAQGETGWN